MGEDKSSVPRGPPVGCVRRGGSGAWTAEDSRVAEKREVSAGQACAEGQGGMVGGHARETGVCRKNGGQAG